MRKQGAISYLRKNKWPYLFLLPFFVLYMGFQLYPQLFSIFLSFNNYKIGKPSEFVGLKNYANALRDPIFWLSLKNTLIFWLGTLPVQLVLAFLVATAMLRLTPRLRGLLSGAYYVPVVTNMVAVILIFQLMYDNNFGILNYLLSLVGLGPVPWLQDPIIAKFSTILLIVWRGFGYYVVFTLAGLMGIDDSLYEYATLEGAGYVQKQWYITLPLLKPVLLYQVFTGTIAGWNTFLEPFLLFSKNTGAWKTYGGPASTGLTVSMYVYTEGFSAMRFGYGAAIALMTAVITTVFAVLQFRFFQGGRED